MAGGQLIHCTPGHEKSYGNIHDTQKGATYTTSCKQKLNTKSSTEAELVAVNKPWDKYYGAGIF